MIDCVVTKGGKLQGCSATEQEAAKQEGGQRGRERTKKESNPNRECFLIKNVGLDDKSGSGM